MKQLLMIAGIVFMAGAAGDMDQNPLGDTVFNVTLLLAGLVMFVTGGLWASLDREAG